MTVVILDAVGRMGQYAMYRLADGGPFKRFYYLQVDNFAEILVLEHVDLSFGAVKNPGGQFNRSRYFLGRFRAIFIEDFGQSL